MESGRAGVVAVLNRVAREGFTKKVILGQILERLGVNPVVT